VRPAAGLAARLIGAALLAGCTSTTIGRSQPVPGYLGIADLATLAGSVPDAPSANSPEQARDIALSQRFRALEDTDRWWMATAHAEVRPPEAAQHFDCALGTRLAEQPRPALDRVMGRLLVDSERLAVDLVARHPRLRPLAVPERRSCQRLNEASRLGATSYPSVAAVAGAAYGEMFADLAPDRALTARQMGQEIGFSRAVCATNWPSDVAVGHALGVALYEASSTEDDFALDLEAARAELIAARAEGLTNPGCASEGLALAQGQAILGD